jgi:transcriptional regulator with XRE-family HTH domain
MSQETLAGLAGVSRPFISMIESGRRTVERRSTLVAIAGALQVSVADLLGQPGDPTDPRKVAAVAHVPAIRAALIEIEEGLRRAPTRSRDDLDAAIDALVDGRRRTADYATMAAHLPGLLYEAAAHGAVAQARVGYETSACVRTLGYGDLALPAMRISLAGAHDADDPAWIGMARFGYTLAMPAEVADTAARVADRALRDLQAAAREPRARQMLGQVHLAAALACATAERADDAAAHLQAAEQEADTLGDPADGLGFNALAFGPTNVGLWRMTVAVELGEHGRAVEIAGRLDPSPLRDAGRRQSYWLELGRAQVGTRHDPQARAAFLHAEQAAPVPFAVNPLARDAVLAMVNRANLSAKRSARRSAVPPDLRVLATRLGIDVDSRHRA